MRQRKGSPKEVNREVFDIEFKFSRFSRFSRLKKDTAKDAKKEQKQKKKGVFFCTGSLICLSR
ncbi:hypothetical protein LJC22_02400 [Desulfosarcina sp. OttesenSCG-928-G10]|nr:hypothetical protein [Desulfosarcina sp. OttesenSCG-928-G10]MDL2321130.1 hypothetical protein [Desulfosarcina sp. OttesenSCG-928-B08]